MVQVSLPPASISSLTYPETYIQRWGQTSDVDPAWGSRQDQWWLPQEAVPEASQDLPSRRPRLLSNLDGHSLCSRNNSRFCRKRTPDSKLTRRGSHCRRKRYTRYTGNSRQGKKRKRLIFKGRRKTCTNRIKKREKRLKNGRETDSLLTINKSTMNSSRIDIKRPSISTPTLKASTTTTLTRKASQASSTSAKTLANQPGPLTIKATIPGRASSTIRRYWRSWQTGGFARGSWTTTGTRSSCKNPARFTI